MAVSQPNAIFTVNDIRELTDMGLSGPMLVKVCEVIGRAWNDIGQELDKRRTYDRDRKRRDRSLRGPDAVWAALVVKIIARDSHRCFYCGSTENLTADHMVPLSRGGTNDEKNLCACCHCCNAKKKNKTAEEFVGKAADLSADLSADALARASFFLSSSTEDSLTNQEKKESKKVVARARGTRLPAGAPLTSEYRDIAVELGFPQNQIDHRWAEFVDYWCALPGTRGSKLDWPATWRNRLRQIGTKGNQNGYSHHNGSRRPANADFFAGIASLAADLTGNSAPSGPPREEVPLGRFNIDG